MKTKVYRDAEGRVVNIGDWQERRYVDQDTDEEVVRNPVPAGVTCSEEEVVETEHGRFAVVPDRTHASETP